MYKILIILLILTVVGCGAEQADYYSTRMAEFKAAPATGKKMIIGDSITCQWQLPAGYANRGIIGDTTGGVLLRIDAHIAEAPAEILLFIGTNDLLFSSNAAALANYAQIVDKIQSAGIPLKIISLLPRAGYDVAGFNSGLQEIAASHDIPYLDWYSKFDVSLTYDGLHPSAAGYEVLNELLIDSR